MLCWNIKHKYYPQTCLKEKEDKYGWRILSLGPWMCWSYKQKLPKFDLNKFLLFMHIVRAYIFQFYEHWRMTCKTSASYGYFVKSNGNTCKILYDYQSTCEWKSAISPLWLIFIFLYLIYLCKSQECKWSKQTHFLVT